MLVSNFTRECTVIQHACEYSPVLAALEGAAAVLREGLEDGRLP